MIQWQPGKLKTSHPTKLYGMHHAGAAIGILPKIESADSVLIQWQAGKLKTSHSIVFILSCIPAGAAIGILPKIESADSVGHLSDILDAADGAMVARGDLGAELPVQDVSALLCLL